MKLYPLLECPIKVIGDNSEIDQINGENRLCIDRKPNQDDMFNPVVYKGIEGQTKKAMSRMYE